MKHPRAAEPAAPALDRDSQELLASFCARLRRERVHMVGLSAALASTEDNPAQIFDALESRAHSLYSDASAIEIAAVADAADALERAALAASRLKSGHTDPAVWTALVALVRLMGIIDRQNRAAASLPPR
jgi:HPt (histidine-containing phosphotransfer) domain-containing protein